MKGAFASVRGVVGCASWRWLVLVVGVFGVVAGVKVVERMPNESATLIGETILQKGKKEPGFGYSVAISADARRVAVSSIGEVEGSSFVRVYEQGKRQNWVQVGSNLESGIEPGAATPVVPVAMSSDGNRVLIADARLDFDKQIGSVVAYDWNETKKNWAQVGQKLESDTGLMGTSVDMSADGSRIVVGIPSNHTSTSNTGIARVYELDESNGSEWVQLGENILGEDNFDEFGKFVSISADGNRVAAGSTFNTGDSLSSGHVRVYERDGEKWIKLGNDIDGEGSFDEAALCKLSADGSRVAVGSYRNDVEKRADSGHVRVYEINEDRAVWEQLGEDIDGDASEDWFGFSLALSGDGERVVISAPGHDERLQDAGKVQVYDYTVAKDGSARWEQVGQTLLGEEDQIYFGWAVAMTEDGRYFAVATYGVDGTAHTIGGYNYYYYETETPSPSEYEKGPSSQRGSVDVYELKSSNPSPPTSPPTSSPPPPPESSTPTQPPTETPDEATPTENPQEATPTETPEEATPTETASEPTPTATPTPAPDPEPACFPGDATVRMADGSVRKMEQLVVGDRVLVANGECSDVFAFGHREPDVETTFVRMETENGAVLKLSPSHYLPVADGGLKVAREVRVGEQVSRGDGKQDRIVALSIVKARGLYNPHTLQGSVVVDDVLASTYTESLHPGLAHLLLSIPRALYRLGVKDPLRSLFHEPAPTFLRSLFPNGPSSLSG